MSVLPDSRTEPGFPARSREPRMAGSAIGAKRLAQGAVILCIVAGTALRVAAARGELWLDEIWSLNLVGAISSADQVFWNISHDNNHLLNSLWLFLAGPGQTAVIYRLPAVVYGSASILAAARIGARRNWATGVAAALLVAFAFPLVNYGSEARGYSGLILGVLLGIDALEHALGQRLASRQEKAAARAPWYLAGAVAFGTLSHFIMLAALALFVASAVLRFRFDGRTWAAVFGETAALFRPTLMLLSPIVLAVGLGVAHKGQMEVGGAMPFEVSHFLSGFGRLIGLLLGAPSGAPLWLMFGLATALGGWIVGGRLIGPDTARLGLAALVLPVVMALAHLPNLEQPRYFLVSGVVFVVILAEAVGRCWHRGGLYRLVAGILLLASLAGQAALDARLLEVGRGSPAAVVAIMTRDGETRYSSNFDFATNKVVDFEARALGVHPIQVSWSDRAAFCSGNPVWFIRDGETTDPEPPGAMTIGPTTCRTSFDKVAFFPVAALSGRQWTLYRRVE